MDSESIKAAAAILAGGGLVAFPTETVYGLGANAANEQAVRRIFEIKERPADHPLIVHLADKSQLRDWVQEIPPAAEILGTAFWPGPLTLVLPRAKHVLDIVTGGQASIGVRVPSHPVAQALLRAFGGGIAAPSANKFGRVSPTLAAHVKAEFGANLALILDGGQSEVGIESTILDLSSEQPVLLRPGMIGIERVSAVLGRDVQLPGIRATRASGMLASHYAPRTPTYLCCPADLDEWAGREIGHVAVIARRASPVSNLSALRWLEASDEPTAYAHDLYANLRFLDALACDSILIEDVPRTSEWSAVRDRLVRATSIEKARA